MGWGLDDIGNFFGDVVGGTVDVVGGFIGDLAGGVEDFVIKDLLGGKDYIEIDGVKHKNLDSARKGLLDKYNKDLEKAIAANDMAAVQKIQNEIKNSDFTKKLLDKGQIDNLVNISEQGKTTVLNNKSAEVTKGLQETVGLSEAEKAKIKKGPFEGIEGRRKAVVLQNLMGEVPEELSKNPAVQQRVADLSLKMTGDDAPIGPDATRSMLANRARQGILGAASAGGDSSVTVGQQSSMRAEANKAIGMKSLAGTESAIQERDAARSALASLKSEVLDSDIKAKEQYKKRQARTAIGLEGITETARQAAMKGAIINK
jgi:hypothetical protein